MLTRCGARRLGVAPGDRFDDRSVLVLDLLRQCRAGRFDAARGLRCAAQEVEQELDQRQKMRVAGRFGDAAVEVDVGVDGRRCPR